MTVECKLILFRIVCVLVEINSFILNQPGYSPEYYYSSPGHKHSLRRTFLNKRRQNLVTAKRVELLDKYLSINSVFVDGIIHEKMDDTHKQWKLVNKIETAFRSLIGMDGVKYYFKRDSYWRTWRKVNFPEGDKMVCYKCESSLHCNECQYAGYWVIDENPPCPYEILSVINNENVCAINFNNSTDVKESCPYVALFTDIMRMCDNPIDTQWRIQKVYKKEVSERYPAMFCGGRDYCEISTLYTISPAYVSFQIINSTNNIMYSKIMKNNRTNYACASDCGMLDPKTKTVTKTDQPLRVNLINTKNKREDKTKGSTAYSKTLRTKQKPKNGSTVFNKTTTLEKAKNQRFNKSKINKLKQFIKEVETIFNHQGNNIARYNDDHHHFHHHRHHHNIKHPTCTSIKHRMEDDMSEDI